MKSYPFIKEGKRKIYFQEIKSFTNSLGGNYLKLTEYFTKYWKDCELFNFTNSENEIIQNRTNNICESFHHKLNKKISHYP